MNILVTGGLGWTAQSIVEALLQHGHTVTVFDLEIAATTARQDVSVVHGSVTDYDQINQAMQGMDAVVHLAVAVGEGDYANSDVPFSANVQGTYHVFKAAHDNAIQKVILMSEAAVHVNYAEGEIVQAKDRLRTTSESMHEHLYDLTKFLQEEIARNYAETFGMNVVVLRPGHIVDGRTQLDPHNRPLTELNYLRGGWVCRYDLATAVLKSLELDLKGYQAFHVVGSETARNRFAISRTEAVLGMAIGQCFG